MRAVLHVSKAVEKLVQKARWIDVNATDNTEISPSLRCGDSQGCFHLQSFTAIKEIVASCEPWPRSTDRFAVAVVDNSNTGP